MRWIFLLVMFPVVAYADSSAPEPWAARCAAHFEAALAKLRAEHESGDDGSLGEVAIRGRKVVYEDVGGWCMNHYSFSAEVEPARGGARRWRRSRTGEAGEAGVTNVDRYHAELSNGRYRGTIDFSSNNESESAGANPEGFIAAFEHAVELCLRESGAK